LDEYLVLVIPYSIKPLTSTLDKTLIAIELFVGRPRILVITGAVTPSALPIEVPAIAVTAAAPKSDRRDIGFFAQLLNKYLLSSLMRIK